MKAIILEKMIGKTKVTRAIKHGYMTVTHNHKLISTDKINIDIDRIVESLVRQGYQIVETDYDQIGDPIVQEELF